MIIKKFEAATEIDAINKAKEELGGSAVIMNIKTTKPKGIFRIFKKPLVEVTAAVEEKGGAKEDVTENATRIIEEALKTQKDGGASIASAVASKRRSSAIEQKLDNLTDMLEKQIVNEPKESSEIKVDIPEEVKEEVRKRILNIRIREARFSICFIISL